MKHSPGSRPAGAGATSQTSPAAWGNTATAASVLRAAEASAEASAAAGAGPCWTRWSSLGSSRSAVEPTSQRLRRGSASTAASARAWNFIPYAPS